MSTTGITDWLAKDENAWVEVKSKRGLIHGVLVMQFRYLYVGSSSSGGGGVHSYGDASSGAVWGGGGVHLHSVMCSSSGAVQDGGGVHACSDACLGGHCDSGASSSLGALEDEGCVLSILSISMSSCCCVLR